MGNAKLDEAQAGIKIAERNINTSDKQMTPPLWRKTKEPLDESEKAGLKLSIKKTKIMASGPITSWQIDGETMQNHDRLHFLGLQNHSRW